MWRIYVTKLCGESMWRIYAVNLCGESMRRIYVMNLCGNASIPKQFRFFFLSFYFYLFSFYLFHFPTHIFYFFFQLQIYFLFLFLFFIYWYFFIFFNFLIRVCFYLISYSLSFFLMQEEAMASSEILTFRNESKRASIASIERKNRAPKWGPLNPRWKCADFFAGSS